MLQEHRRIGFGGPIEAAAQAKSLSSGSEEAVFLDEPAGSAAPLRVQDTSAFETFPDEDYGKDPVAAAKNDRGPIRLFEVKRAPADALITDDVAAVGRIRPGLLLLFFLAAALTAFGTVRAFQVSGISSVTLWQLIGR